MLKELIAKRTDLETQVMAIQEQIAAVNIDIEHVVAGKLADLRKLQGKEFGTVNLSLGGYKVTETVPKKVEWDQEKMNQMFDRIAAAGDDPRAYMKLKLEVSEKSYEAFPAPVQAMFADCRTVKPGKPSLKFDMEVSNA
ncbi:MAG: hypothetical protein PHI31_09885 [Desulfuromonadaceae bacterium]|nr:hypothetical protein [Desulfuromonadaceae bacterium]